MKINLEEVKTTILGIQGSGKTVLVKELIRQFKHPLVYGVHTYEWIKASDKITVYTPLDFSLKSFDNFAGELVKGKKDGSLKYDVLVIDEADMFFRSNFDIYNNINDLFISHRHYKIALIFITRRPQDISTKVYESSEHLFVFAIEGINVKKYLENLHEDMKERLKELRKDSHNFIYKRIGYPPKLFAGISTNVDKKLNKRSKST